MNTDTISARQINDAAPLRGRATVSGLVPTSLPQSAQMALAMGRLGKPVFAGIPASVKAERRARGKRQRAARRAAR